MDQDLTVKISADTSGFTSGSSEVLALLQQIETDLAAMGTTGAAAGAEVAGGHRVAAAAAGEHAAAERIMGATVSESTAATNALARAMGALGFEAGAATERVAAFGEAADGLGKAAPELLGIGAALLAIAGTAELLKDSIADAAAEQQSLVAIGQAVKNQGGDWDTAKDGVEAFARAIEETTTYSAGEALEAMRELTTAGISVSDSEKLIAIATDVAAGSGKGFLDVVGRIIEAEHGRAQGLQELDPKLRALIKSHADLDTIMLQLASDFRNQAAAALDTLSGSAKRLNDEFEHSKVAIGDNFLPYLTGANYVLLNLAMMAEHDAGMVGKMFGSFVEGARVAGAAMFDFGKLAADSLNPFTRGNDAGDFSKLQADAAQFKAAIGSIGNDISNTDAFAFLDPKKLAARVTEFEQQITGAFKTVADARNKSGLDSDPIMGNEPKGPTSSPIDSTAAEDPSITKATTQYEEAQKRLDAVLKSLTGDLDTYKATLSLATDDQMKYNATMALANETTLNAQKAQALLTTAIASQQAQQKALNAELPAEAKAYQDAKAAYDDYRTSLHGDATKEQREHLDELGKRLKDAADAYNKTAAGVDKLNGFIAQNKEALDALVPALNAHNVAMAEQIRLIDASLVAEQKKIQADDDATKKEQDRRDVLVQNVQFENALYGKSLAQQLAFYEQRYALEKDADLEYTDEGKATFEKIISIESDMYKQRVDAGKEFYKTEQTDEENWLNIILTGHKSLRDELAQIWDQIEKDLLKSIEQMIVDSKLVSGMNLLIAKDLGIGNGPPSGAWGSSGSAGGASGAAAAASQYGILGVSLGPEAAQSAIASLPTNAGVTGYFTGTAGAWQTSTAPNVADASGMAGGTAGKYPSASSSPTVLASAVTGAGIGGAIASADGGNSLLGSVLGGAAGLLKFGGPYGAAIGFGVDAIAGLVGSLIGPHWGPASNYPDRSQPGYGQWLTNWQGSPANVNGQIVDPQIQYATAFGGTSLSSAIEQWVQTAGSDPSSLSPGLANLLKQFQALGPNLAIAGEHNGVFTLGDGKTIGVQQLESMLSQWQSATGGTSSSPEFQLSRTYPNLNLSTLSGQVGSVNSLTGAYTGSSYGTAATALTAPAAPTVNVTINGDLIGTLPDTVIQAIATGLKKLGNGQIAGGYLTTTRAVRGRSNGT